MPDSVSLSGKARGFRILMSKLVDVRPWLAGQFYRMVSPVFFRSVGRRCRIFRRLHIARPFSDIRIGDDCILGIGIFLQTGRHSSIRIGNQCTVNSACHIVAGVRVEIGDNVAIAEFVSIRDQEHLFDVHNGVRGQGYVTAPIVIEDNVWIGRGVYIGPGSHIRRGSKVGANSVVRGSFPPNVLIAGAPAKVKKQLG